MDSLMGAEQALGQVLFPQERRFSFQHLYKALSQYTRLEFYQSVSCASSFPRSDTCERTRDSSTDMLIWLVG
jgi:hypothetical protein